MSQLTVENSLPSSPTRLPVRYFDGQSSRPYEVDAWFEGGQLHLHSADIDRLVLVKLVQWPERTTHGPRLALLPDGGSLQTVDSLAWDSWVQSARADPIVVRLQQSWRGVALSVILLLAFATTAYLWGLPWASREIAQRIPDSIESQAGDVVLRQLVGLTQPSKLPEKEQQAIEQAWRNVLAAHTQAQQAKGIAIRPTRLLIRDSDIGPNALALPGGVIILTDDMVRLVRNDVQVVTGVLAHELGHVQNRHGMQMLVQVSVLGLVASAVWGDYSGVLAAVPLWVGHAHYSRTAEREADAYSAEVLRDAGVAPSVMVSLFERLQLFKLCGRSVLESQTVRSDTYCKKVGEKSDGENNGTWGLGFASHPSDESRIDFFRSSSKE